MLLHRLDPLEETYQVGGVVFRDVELIQNMV